MNCFIGAVGSYGLVESKIRISLFHTLWRDCSYREVYSNRFIEFSSTARFAELCIISLITWQYRAHQSLDELFLLWFYPWKFPWIEALHSSFPWWNNPIKTENEVATTPRNIALYWSCKMKGSYGNIALQLHIQLIGSSLRSAWEDTINAEGLSFIPIQIYGLNRKQDLNGMISLPLSPADLCEWIRSLGLKGWQA